jgi:hypothetical protein
MRPGSLLRRIAPLALGLIVVALVPAAAAAPAPPRISGANATVWNIAAPTPSYTVTGSARGVTITWTLSGTTRKGSGRSPLTVRLAGLPTGTYNLDAAESPGGAKARRIVRVDVTPPTIAVRQPVDGALYLPGQAVEVDYSCGGGAVTCTGTLADAAPLPTDVSGPGTLSVTASDAAGNPASRTVAFAVGPGPPVITGRPPQPVRGNRPVFSWAGGDTGALFTWQVLSQGTVVSQGDTFDASVTLGPLLPGAYAFQVRQTRAGGRPGPFSVADPFTVVQAVPAALRPTPRVRTPSRLTPRPGATLTRPRPLLRWRAVPGATLYNLQIFQVRGASLVKVSSIFPRGTRARPAGLRFGVRYAWRVWPYSRRAGYADEPLGLSYFDLVRPVRVDGAQMLVNRRIAEAAVRRVAAIEQWLAAGITAGDIRHGGLGAAAFDAALRPAGGAESSGTAAAAVRPIGTGATTTRTKGPIRANGRQMLRTQRIAQSAVRRIEGLEARLKAGLTGGDIADGSIGSEKLAAGVSLGAAGAPTVAAPATVTVVPPRKGRTTRVRVTAAQLLVTQEIAQGAVRRAEALRRRLAFGLSTADFQPGSIGTADLASSLTRRR